MIFHRKHEHTGRKENSHVPTQDKHGNLSTDSHSDKFGHCARCAASQKVECVISPGSAPDCGGWWIGGMFQGHMGKTNYCVGLFAKGTVYSI